MVLNRNTDRRRRLLVDSNSPVGEVTAQTRSSAETPGPDNEGLLDVRRAYAIGAHRRHQRKITDLIPKRPLAYSAAIGVVVLLLVGVNLLAYFSPSWKSVIGSEGVAALALVGPQTITTWLATVFLAITAGLCLQIYALRQHRSDDYEGSYRIWAWLSIVLAVASLACVVPVGSIAQNIFSAVTGREFASAWLPSTIGITFASLLLVRYLMEVRTSYGTVAWAGLAWLAICVRVASPEMLGAVLPQSIDQDQASNLAWGNGLFIAAAATLLANVTYGRFVFLRANGFIASKPKSIEQTVDPDSPSLRERFAMKRAAFKQTAEAKRAERQAAKDAKVAAKAAAAAQRAETKAAAQLAAQEKAKAKQANKSKADSPAKANTQPSKKAAPAQTPEPTATPTASKKRTKAKAKKATQPAPVQPSDQPAILKMSSTVAPPAKEDSSKPISDSASAKLKQLADAARAKKAAAETADSTPTESNKKLSKSERRRQRKMQRQQKRAA